MRFSIKGMLIGVGAVALGCAALLNANAVWGGLAYLSALLSISVALVAVIHLRGGRRAFWTGFAVCGWVYLLHIAAHPASNWARSMPTTEFLDYLQEIVQQRRRDHRPRAKG